MKIVELTDAEQIVALNALEHVFHTSSDEEWKAIIADQGPTNIFAKIRDAKSPDYVLYLSAKEAAILVMIMVEAVRSGEVGKEEMEGIAKSLYEQSVIRLKARGLIHDPTPRTAAQSGA